MRVNPDTFNEFNQRASKGLRLVIKIDFPTPIYLTSHSGIPNIPANRIDDCVQNVSSSSQRLLPDQGRGEIGSISFNVVDVDGDVTTEFRTQQNAGEGLTGRKIELYRGGDDLDWSDFRLEQTQQIDRAVTFSKGAYKIQCSDIQRAMRKDIFDIAKTRLAATFDVGEATINVFDTSDFEACTHKTSFGDQTTGSFYYIKIKYKNGFEIVRATGKTATTFTGCVRGLFGTDNVKHTFPTGTDADTGVTVEEYVYLELPAPAMAYALLTGTIIGGGTIPARWHLGISTADVNQSSFENIGEDWFDSSDYAKGLILRFQGVGKSDGKRFIEREVCLLAGAFLLVGADGKLNMRRMTGVISSADHVAEIGPDNAIAHGPIKHELSRVRNTFDVEWAFVDIPGESKPIFVRRNILVDATSIGIHGESKPLALQFKGLHNERHTFTTLINRFDALRDRYSGPPITFNVDLLPSMNDLEVGDIVRATFPNVRDFSGSGTLDRAFEVQRLSINQATGRVSAELFGSTSKADPIADAGAGANSELPDSWYSSAGTEMAAAGLTINGSGQMTASGSLTGGTTTRTIFYYLGDFTINSGVTLTVTGNVELRIRGHFQINGTLKATTGLASNTAGFLGITVGGRTILADKNTIDIEIDPIVFGQNSVMPVLEIENNAGTLEGIPADMRGSGGANGGDVNQWNVSTEVFDFVNAGGAGGVGGGSVVAVSRGAGYGASGETVLDGGDGSVGTTSAVEDSGSGGGGSPGTLVHLLDGSAVGFPILAGNVQALYGTSPITNGNSETQGKAKASNPLDLGVAAARVAYVPVSRDPYPEYTNAEITTANSGKSSIVKYIFIRSASAPSTPAVDDGSYNFSTNTLTPPTGWSDVPPAVDGNPLYVSTGLFDIVGTTGIDLTVTWTAPSLFVQDGADGSGNSVFYATVFKRSASAPSTPTVDDGSYNFSTNTLTPPTGWSITPPATDGNPLYVSNGTFEALPAGTDNTVTWSAAAELVSDGVNGSPGGDGDSIHFASIFKRSASPPSTPTGGSYNFTTKTLTPPSTWSTTPPAADGNPLYVSNSTAEINGTTGIDSTLTWTSPAELVSDGVDGTNGSNGSDGDSVHVSTIYRRSSSAPATPTGGSYNFTSKTLTPPTDWFEAVPAGADPLYSSVGTWSINGTTGTDSSTTWSAAVKVDEGGATIGDISNFNVDDVEFGANAEGAIQADADGDTYRRQGAGGSLVSQYTWMGNASNADYEVMGTVLAGSAPTSGASINVWLASSTDRLWTWLQTSTGTLQATFSVKYRRKSDNLEMAESIHDVTVQRI